MKDILERAKAHYAGLPRRDIKIVEWGTVGKPAVITWTALTVRDQERIYALDDAGRSPIGGTVRMRAVIFKACDVNGKLLFDGMDEHALRHEVDGDIVGRIANAILFDAGVTKKDGETVPIDEQIEASKNG